MWTKQDVFSVRYNIPLWLYQELVMVDAFPTDMAVEDRFYMLDAYYRPEVDANDLETLKQRLNLVEIVEETEPESAKSILNY